MATAGKVAPTPKDKFVNGTAYDKLDVVEYNGTLYIAKKASAGILPTDPEYWMLAVDLTGKLDTTGDTENNTVTFESGDEADPTAWKNVNVLGSKEKHSSLLKKISTMFSNVRYLYKLLGTTDISSLGTVTQALANFNDNVGDIKGIISSLADCSAATVAGYAADALAVKELNSNLLKHIKCISYGSGTGFFERKINIPLTFGGLYLIIVWSRYVDAVNVYVMAIHKAYSDIFSIKEIVKQTDNITVSYDVDNQQLYIQRGTGNAWNYSVLKLSEYAYNTYVDLI